MGKRDTWDGIGAGMVGIGEISDAVPADVKAEALAMKDAIAQRILPPVHRPAEKAGRQRLAGRRRNRR